MGNNPLKNVIDEDIFDDDEEEEKDELYLSFKIADETYAIDIANVLEIIRLIKVTPIPESLPFIKGVINLRSRIIPVMDVRTRFHLPYKDYEDRTCIVVVNIKGCSMGLIVDSVAEVLEIPESSVEGIHQASQSTHQQFIKGIGKIEDTVKIIIDLDKLLFDHEIEQLKRI